MLTADLRVNLTQYSLAHLGATLTLGAVWGTTRAAVLSTPVLRWVDTATLIVSCLLFAVMGGGMAQLFVAAGEDPTQALLVGQLAAGSTILTRAVALPSTPARTFWLGLVVLVPRSLRTTPPGEPLESTERLTVRETPLPGRGR